MEEAVHEDDGSKPRLSCAEARAKRPEIHPGDRGVSHQNARKNLRKDIIHNGLYSSRCQHSVPLLGDVTRCGQNERRTRTNRLGQDGLSEPGHIVTLSEGGMFESNEL